MSVRKKQSHFKSVYFECRMVLFFMMREKRLLLVDFLPYSVEIRYFRYHRTISYFLELRKTFSNYICLHNLRITNILQLNFGFPQIFKAELSIQIMYLTTILCTYDLREGSRSVMYLKQQVRIFEKSELDRSCPLE